ncbi:hypothetical protein Q9233_002878 [Columba guinea]|nr:hypothetical protein Q9233_002878 [Columba guinea]
MMCLESDGSSGSSPGCGGRLRAGDEEEEEDGERGCCGRGAEGEVQTLSGRMNPPAAGKHPERPSARHKAPSLGRARVAAAGILSVGNVLNYLDRYTVAVRTRQSTATLQLCSFALTSFNLPQREEEIG